MKSIMLAAVASIMAIPTVAMVVPKSSSSRVVGVDIQRRDLTSLARHDKYRLRRRADTLELTLANEETLYLATVSVGTPSQSIRLHIDTGSSDLWVNTASSSLCSRRNYCDGGTFDSDSSSTFTLVNSDFNITYSDGSGAAGDYVKDTLTVGNVTLSDFQFGLGESSTSSEGVLGIGYVANEVQVQVSGSSTYPNLPQALKNAGNIARNAYSLWLNDQEANTGTILFGGVNTAKFQDSLATLPVISASGVYVNLEIALTGVSIAGTSLSSSSSLPVAALLDSGTTLTYLPTDITSTIYDQVGAVYDEQQGYGVVDCDVASSDQTIEYSFSGKAISVALEELVINEGSGNGGSCIFGIAPTDGISILGDTFLRSAYVVYDLENNEISIGQTVFNATDDSVQEIPSGTSLPPGASAVANAVTAVNGVAGSGSSADTTSPRSTSAGFKILARPSSAIIAVVIAWGFMLIG